MRRKAKRRSATIRENQCEEKLSGGFGVDVPPVSAHVKIYFLQKGLTEPEAEAFFIAFNAVDWKTGSGKPIRNWKVLASDWIFDSIQRKKLRRRQSLFQ
ncbi:hypothetical protein [Daejeonella sp.]|uniref:hypothetical protein n=1 Tax=Daejeonella sp. TaxID=2805397 RepID=UPI0030BCDB75